MSHDRGRPRLLLTYDLRLTIRGLFLLQLKDFPDLLTHTSIQNVMAAEVPTTHYESQCHVASLRVPTFARELTKESLSCGFEPFRRASTPDAVGTSRYQNARDGLI